MLSLEKYRIETWKSSSWAAIPSTTGERVRRINWFEANVKILDANWMRIRKLVPVADDAKILPIRASPFAMLMLLQGLCRKQVEAKFQFGGWGLLGGRSNLRWTSTKCMLEFPKLALLYAL